MTSEQLASTLAQIIRVGMVTARDPAMMRVQVECSDTVTSALVTEWLLVLTPRAKEDKQFDLPDIGDQVLCIFLPNGLEQGFVLGSMYAPATTGTPPVQNGDKWHRRFKDGTTIEYDRVENKMTLSVMGDMLIDVVGNVAFKAGGTIKLNASHISMQE